MKPGVWELLIILVIIMIIFGAGRLPEVMKSMGRGWRELRKAAKGGSNKVKGDKKE